MPDRRNDNQHFNPSNYREDDRRDDKYEFSALQRPSERRDGGETHSEYHARKKMGDNRSKSRSRSRGN